MNSGPARKRILISYAAFFLLFAAVAARAIVTLRGDAGLSFMIAMLMIYLLVLVAEPGLLERSVNNLHAINAIQALVSLGLLLLIGHFDFFSMLLIPLCGQSIQFLPRKTALAWIGAIIVLNVAALLIHFPLIEAVGYIIVYPTAIFLIAGLCFLAMQAEEAQAELQEANRKLQLYAAQVQELAAAKERNRLARELHDSVTQVIFGLTLSAQAARILIQRDPARAATELDHIQSLAQNALSEMRSLIQQLHPHSAVEDGLAAGLRKLAAERQASDGLEVELRVSGEQRLPAKVEEELYRVAQEALNNIVKHARTTRAEISLNLAVDGRVEMGITDSGAGFDPTKTRVQAGHLGLTSMTERIQALGGTLTIDSKPGKGTRLRVDLALAQEEMHGG